MVLVTHRAVKSSGVSEIREKEKKLTVSCKKRVIEVVWLLAAFGDMLLVAVVVVIVGVRLRVIQAVKVFISQIR